MLLVNLFQIHITSGSLRGMHNSLYVIIFVI